MGHLGLSKLFLFSKCDNNERKKFLDNFYYFPESQEFAYTDISMPWNNLGKLRW